MHRSKRLYRNLVFLLFSIILLYRPSSVLADDWVQEAHDAQRTGYTVEEPAEPWTFVWSWNGPDSSGGTGGHFYNAPQDARTITANGMLFAPAGSQGLYALNLTSGTQVWHFSSGNVAATPAYDATTNSIILGTTSGIVYQLNAQNGQVISSFNAQSSIDKATLLDKGFAYVVTSAGNLYKLSLSPLTSRFSYSAGSPAVTPPSISASGVVVFATQDLYVHGVSASNGSRLWRTKPTSLSPSSTYTFDGFWPVIANTENLVFVRMNIGNTGLWSGNQTGGKYPTTNAAIKSYLAANPQYQNLFALNLTSGQPAFIPAVGPGGVEGYNGGPDIRTGPVPVIRAINSSHQVAYQIFRNGQVADSSYDGRWDSHLGEMVLDNSTISGYNAGDLRFVGMEASGQSYTLITDEQTPISMAGSTIFNAHWGASESIRITDRSSSKGSSLTNPFSFTRYHPVIRQIAACGTKNASTHYSTCGLTMYQDGRYWAGPGWWTYWNVTAPPGSPASGAYSAGLLPRYTYVAGGHIIVEGNGGDLMVFTHSGTISPPPPTVTSGPTPTPAPTTVQPTFTPAPSLAPSPTPISTGGSSYEAESSSNTLNGSAVVNSCSACSGGYSVGWVGGGSTNTLQFNNVYSSFTGSVPMTIYYVNGDTTSRTGYVSVSSGNPTNITFPSTGNWTNISVGTITINVNLVVGNNTIKFGNDTTYAPDLDRIVLAISSPSTTPTPKPGDANGDGKVDGIDYVIWFNHYNQNISGVSNGDFNGDGKVDGIDYIIWLNNYGK